MRARFRNADIAGSRIRGAVEGVASLTLAGFNLTNRRDSAIDYFYESRLRGEAAAVADIHFHPIESRSFRLSVTANF